MACEYYYFCGDHKCSLAGRYGERITDSQYASYCKYNGYKCDKLKNNKNKTNQNTHNPNNNNTSSSCFITTVVCNILGKKDNDKLLNNLRFFRDNVLQQDKEKYTEILQSYDTVGPIIANCIINDKNKSEMSNGLYNIVLKPISKLIEQNKYNEACEKYYLMTLSLINYYGLKNQYNNITDNNYGYEREIDIKKSGHGKKRVLQKTNEEH